MMPETANDTVQIGKDAEVEYLEAYFDGSDGANDGLMVIWCVPIWRIWPDQNIIP